MTFSIMLSRENLIVAPYRLIPNLPINQSVINSIYEQCAGEISGEVFKAIHYFVLMQD